MDRKVSSLLSLCKRAGKLSTGEFSCEKALQRDKCRFLIIATDASENTIKKFSNKALYYEVDFKIYETREELSKSIGEANRVVISINDENFANKIKDLLLL